MRFPASYARQMGELQREAYGPRGDPNRHLSLDQLEAGLRALPAPGRGRGNLKLIVRRHPDGEREKLEQARLSPEEGVPGDGWNRRPPRDPEGQLTVMRADLASLIANGQDLTLFGDNLFVELDLSAEHLPAGTRIRLGEATVEASALPHDGCSKFKGRFGQDALRFVQARETRCENRRGIYWKVVDAGEVRVGDPIEILSRPAGARPIGASARPAPNP